MERENEKVVKIVEESGLDTILEYLGEETPIDVLQKTDAIFVFGHFQPGVAYHAAHLWKEKKSDRMVIAGGKGIYPTPSPFSTQADFYASIVKEKGIPEDALILEHESSNVLENVVFGMRTCHALGFFPKTPCKRRS